jgi:hypothetical protein
LSNTRKGELGYRIREFFNRGRESNERIMASFVSSENKLKQLQDCNW